MRENRTYGSEGGEAKAFPTPITEVGASQRSGFCAEPLSCHGRPCGGHPGRKCARLAMTASSRRRSTDRDGRHEACHDSEGMRFPTRLHLARARPIDTFPRLGKFRYKTRVRI